VPHIKVLKVITIMSQSEDVDVLPGHKLARKRYCCLILNKMKKHVSRITFYIVKVLINVKYY